MKLRLYLQAAVYCTVVLGASLANAADVNFSNEEQRFRELEKRINSLETAKFDAISYTDSSRHGANHVANHSGASCGASPSAACRSGSCWLHPRPTAQFDAELVLLTASNSEAQVSHSQNNVKAGFRLAYTRVNERGNIFRVRYFNFGINTEANASRYDLEMVDTEIGRRFTLGGGLHGEFTAGVRYASYNERNELMYNSTFGPLVGVQLRGQKFLRGTSFVNLRHSLQFGDGFDFQNAATPGTFSITEVQLGLEWRRPCRMGMLVVRTALEAQYWGGVQDNDSEDLGLIGSATSIGLAY